MLKLRLFLVSALPLLVLACGSSPPYSAPTPTPSPSPTPSGSTAAVSIPIGAQTLAANAYVPNPLNVAVGTTVTWTNTDSIAHTSTADGGAFSSGTILAGGHFDFPFQSRGTFPYHCAFHPGMVGTVVVQ
jgi:plastocyanin